MLMGQAADKGVAERAPGLRRADLFAREKREGWDCWDDEVEKFAPAHKYPDRRAIMRGQQPGAA
jgi:N6-adenosine-specific RNA methylase IME4